MAVKLMTTLRGRLLLLILLAVAPTIAIEVYSQVVLRGTRQAEIRQEAVRLMRLVAAEQGRIDGVFKQQIVLYVARIDFGQLPAIGRTLNLDKSKYRVIDAIDEGGIYSITLEAVKS